MDIKITFCIIHLIILNLLLTKASIVKNDNPQVKYTPDWTSIDSRPLPSWFDQAKVGIFLHWGVYSVPSYGPQGVAWLWWFWKGTKDKQYVDFIKKNYPPDFTYADFAPNFRAEFYNPEKWVEIFKASGAKYVVLTSKHHEGYAMWPTKYSFNWNVMDVGPQRNLLGWFK